MPQTSFVFSTDKKYMFIIQRLSGILRWFLELNITCLRIKKVAVSELFCYVLMSQAIVLPALFCLDGISANDNLCKLRDLPLAKNNGIFRSKFLFISRLKKKEKKVE